ncbi:MAG: PCRF domain-containing protein, partial [Clostridia bacterium]|nr:PCRF domain-containing protein [Clostridia bacterium]
MFEKLAGVEEKYIALETRLADPEVVSDIQTYTALLKEHKNMTPVVETYRAFRNTEAALEEANAILEDPDADREFKDLAREEADEARAALERLAEELKVLLLPRDPNDDKNVILEIRSGAG